MVVIGEEIVVYNMWSFKNTGDPKYLYDRTLFQE